MIKVVDLFQGTQKENSNLTQFKYVRYKKEPNPIQINGLGSFILLAFLNRNPRDGFVNAIY